MNNKFECEQVDTQLQIIDTQNDSRNSFYNWRF